jgi:hypothetical protein
LKGYALKTYLALAVLLLSAIASAETLTGTVRNVTTGKPASGDEVVLIKLGAGMEEVAHTKTDSKGNFSFKLDDSQGPHLVRAIHQDVPYHTMAPPGTTSVNVEVYDAGKKIDGVVVVADIMRLQVENGQLEITREFAVQNSSKPPRTQMNDRDLEFYLPEGAQIGEASALTEHGNPLKTAPVQEEERNRYAFVFPLRPGITQFQISYQLPYNGSANVDPRSLYPLQHFVAIVPKAMTFSAAPSASFKPMNDPNQPDANVQLASSTTAGQSLAFKISGEGTLQARVEGSGAQGGGMGAQSQNDDRPGGGLGPPIDAPDPLDQYRWYILGGFAVVLASAAIYVVTRRKTSALAGDLPKAEPPKLEGPQEDRYVDYESTEAPSGSAPAVRATPVPFAATRSSTSMLLEALKEELFQLEVDRQQGHISQQEYDKTKAALDQTLQRALKRAPRQL